MTTNVNTTKTAAAGTAPSYFNFHANGVGWMNRIRLVTPKRGGNPFLACSISVLYGATDAPERTCLDLRVSGGEAQKLVERLQKHLDAKKKIFVAFKAGDMYPHLYERKNNETGRMETAALIKGRLLALSSIKIDGEKVWPVEKPAEAPAAEAEETPAPAAAPAPAPAPEPAKAKTEPVFTKNIAGKELAFHEAGEGCYAAVF